MFWLSTLNLPASGSEPSTIDSAGHLAAQAGWMAAVREDLRATSGRAGATGRGQSGAHSGVRLALLPPSGGWMLCSMGGGASLAFLGHLAARAAWKAAVPGIAKDLFRLRKDFIQLRKDFIQLRKDFIRSGKDFVRSGKDFIRLGKDSIQLGKNLVRTGKDFIRFGKNLIHTERHDD